MNFGATCSRQNDAEFARPNSAYFDRHHQRLLVTNRAATFLVRVAGNSMSGERLFNDELAIVDSSLTPQDGDIVVVDVDGERSFKVCSRQGAGITLSFANPRYTAYRIDAEALVEVWGHVSGSVNTRRRAVRG